MRAALRPESVRESEKVRVVDRAQHRDDGALDDLVFQRGNAERPLPPVRLRDVRATHRLRSVRPSLQPVGEVLEIRLQGRPVVLPCFAIDAGRRVPLHREVGRAQPLDVVHVVEKRREPLFPVLLCCLTYTLERAGRAGPALCPGRVALGRVPLGPLPSLPRLRRPFRGVVRRVLRVLRSGPTSRARPSSTCVFRLLDAALVCAKASTGPPGSRARCVRACSGSQTAQGSRPSCDGDGRDVAFRSFRRRRHPGGEEVFAAQYPAHASPCQRFTAVLAGGRRMTRR